MKPTDADALRRAHTAIGEAWRRLEKIADPAMASARAHLMKALDLVTQAEKTIAPDPVNVGREDGGRVDYPNGIESGRAAGKAPEPEPKPVPRRRGSWDVDEPPLTPRKPRGKW